MRSLLASLVLGLAPLAASASVFPCTFDIHIDSFVQPDFGWPVTPIAIGNNLAFTGITSDIGAYYALLQDCKNNHHVLANSGINPASTASEFATAVQGFLATPEMVSLESFKNFVIDYGAEIRMGNPDYEPVGSCDCERLWPNGVTE